MTAAQARLTSRCLLFRPTHIGFSLLIYPSDLSFIIPHIWDELKGWRLDDKIDQFAGYKNTLFDRLVGQNGANLFILACQSNDLILGSIRDNGQLSPRFTIDLHNNCHAVLDEIRVIPLRPLTDVTRARTTQLT